MNGNIQNNSIAESGLAAMKQTKPVRTYVHDAEGSSERVTATRAVRRAARRGRGARAADRVLREKVSATRRCPNAATPLTLFPPPPPLRRSHMSKFHVFEVRLMAYSTSIQY